MDDRKKIGIDSADTQNRSEFGGQGGSVFNQDRPAVEENKL